MLSAPQYAWVCLGFGQHLLDRVFAICFVPVLQLLLRVGTGV